MNVLSKDIVAWLTDEETLGDSVTLVYGDIPQGAENAVGVKDTPGPAVDQLMDGSELDRSTAQISSRNNDPDTAASNLGSVLTALKGSGKVTVNGTVYAGFLQTSTVFDLGRDEHDRKVYAAHVQAIRT